MAPPEISVIVPVRNEATSLPLLLEQLFAQSLDRDQFEILVADGRSTDNSGHGSPSTVICTFDKSSGPSECVNRHSSDSFRYP